MNEGAPYVLIRNSLQNMLSKKCKVQKVCMVYFMSKKEEGDTYIGLLIRTDYL